MFSRIFPRQLDNAYGGHRLAIWMLAAIVIVRLIQGVNSTLLSRFLAVSADGIPLYSYSPAAAQTIVSTIALLGFQMLVLPAQGVVVLIRYRAMIPFMYLLLLFQQLGQKAVLLFHPIARTGASGANAGSVVVLAILAMTVVGFAH